MIISVMSFLRKVMMKYLLIEVEGRGSNDYKAL